MSEKIIFPWTEPLEETSALLTNKGEKEKAVLSKELFYRALPFLVLISALLIFFALKEPAKKNIPNIEHNNSYSVVDVIVSMIPQAKGSLLRPESLKQIPVSKKSLSKKQLFDYVQPQDLEKIQNKFALKKDLAPNKPLFWSDLTFPSSAIRGQVNNNTKVIYSEGTP